MAESAEVESTITNALGLEKRWNWMGSAESCERALKLVPKDDSMRAAAILERKAYAIHRAALQADTHQVFENRTGTAIELYTKALRILQSSTDPASMARANRCEAMLSYLEYWLALDAPSKKSHIDAAWAKGKNSLNGFESAGESLEFARTFNQIALAAALSYNYDGVAQSRESTLKEALSYAEKSILHISGSGNDWELAKIHAKATGLLAAIEKDFATFNKKDKLDLEAWDHWTKARSLDDEAALSEIPYVVILQSWPAACKTEERTAIYGKGLELARRTKDHFIIGCVLDGLAQRKFLMAMSSDDSSEIEQLSNEGFEKAKASRASLEKIGFISPNVICVWTMVPEAGYYYSFSSEERGPVARKELLYKAHKPCIEQVQLALESGYPDVRCAARFMMGSVLKGLGTMESGMDLKRNYLEKAVEYLTLATKEDKMIHPTQYYPQGLDLLNLAEAHYEIAQITTDLEKKTSILREAVDSRREALRVCEKEFAATQDSNPDLSGEIAGGYQATGSWVRDLCGLTGDDSCLGMVVECLEKAVDWYSRAGQASQSAAANWEVAQTYDRMSEFLKASERFDLAAEDYRKAAESIPRLDEFYADHAIYMRAWAEIERGRYHHSKQEPGLAKECYESAAAMHKSTRRWSYLTTNYSAWAKVEKAEGLSHDENYEESINAFEEASRLFQESEMAIHSQLSRIEDPAEKESARNLERAADRRSSYCRARIILEKARVLGKERDALATADKYGQAAAAFDKILAELISDQDKKEIMVIAKLSRAWQAMAQAEAEASPSQYEKASTLFEEAKDLSIGEKSKLLMAGHSRFCKALAIGADFVDTGDVALYTRATKHLESAADCYLKANHLIESEYAKASKLLLDGYFHMGRASREEDQDKKAKFYMMAEKVLNTSASAFDRSKEFEKRDQVHRLLEKIREERELALSLTEVLHAPDALTATTSFQTPTPTHETATGRERLEHADVQFALIAHPKTLHVGQDLEIVIEMTNAGKGPARLKMVENLFPKCFMVITKPDTCQIEDTNLNLRHKRLDALTSEVIKLVLKPSETGKFPLKPKIIYEDESGASKEHQPEPMVITVKELGISGWLKGT